MSLLKPSEYLFRIRSKLATSDKWFSGGKSSISWVKARKQGMTCVGVAIEDVTKSEKMQKTLRNLIRKFIPYNTIPDWNDAAKTTHDEILQVLDKAIALAKRQEI